MQLDSMEKNDLISCLLGLNELEKKVLLFLFETPSSSIIEISLSVDRHRSSVQKIVGQLIDKGLLMRKTVTLRRGYNFIYDPIPKEKIKKTLLEDIDRWSELVKERIERW